MDNTYTSELKKLKRGVSKRFGILGRWKLMTRNRGEHDATLKTGGSDDPDDYGTKNVFAARTRGYLGG